MIKFISDKPKRLTPPTLHRVMELVKCASIVDFIDPKTHNRKVNMPYWLLTHDDVLWFEFVNSKTTKEDLLEPINSGEVYIRIKDIETDATRKNYHHEG